jgi:hypothetical protein
MANNMAINLSKKDKSILQKLIYITIIFIIVLLVCYAIIGAYIMFDRYVVPAITAEHAAPASV